MSVRVLLWRLLALAALPLGVASVRWLGRGGVGAELRGGRVGHGPLAPDIPGPLPGPTAGWLAAAAALLAAAALYAAVRLRARRRRRYVRHRIDVHRGDHAGPLAVADMFDALHQRLLQRWWRRLLRGQPSVALEVHARHGSTWLAVCCPHASVAAVEAALRTAYPHLRLSVGADGLSPSWCVLRCKKRSEFVARLKVADPRAAERSPMDGLLTAMAALGADCSVQVALTPAPLLFERWAWHRYRRRAGRLAGLEHPFVPEEQHRPLFFADVRILAPTRATCEGVAAQLRAHGAENRLVERGTAVRHGWLRLYRRRIARGEGNPLPSPRAGVLASTELPALWQLPSVNYLGTPFARAPVPRVPAPPGVLRPTAGGAGVLRDALGPVSIHPELRRQNVAVPGAVEQGKTSFLAATVAEDLLRRRCAVIVLDPKGDAAEAALSLVPQSRTCTLLDFAHPTCGFNPLAVHAPADVIADFVVAAMRNLFTDADIRASSDRYLRNAIIAVLAADSRATLWDAARLLSVGEEGYAYRRRIAARVRGLPELKEISTFFASELSAQLADARSQTTAKLDAPVNKLARLLNSASIKRVLLNDSLAVDLDRIIAAGEVLVVRGALGEMGAGNTSVLMQLIVGMLDAALARQQDRVAAGDRVAVALKVDEAPLVINRGFAETLALKRSAGLETVACWQADAQWVNRDVRDQLDALFAHRVYFATASVADARASASLLMAEFADSVRSGLPDALSALGRPEARLRLPRHHAIVSWTTPEGRQTPFVGQTVPLVVDRTRVEWHARRQSERGGRYLSDLRQPHWEAPEEEGEPGPAAPVASVVRSEAVAEQAPASYRELVDLDGAQRMRMVAAAAPTGVHEPEALDLEVLLLVARLRHVLSSQVHRHLGASRSVTTTQRRLKRLADAGWIRRVQFHRPDGGGVPTCCVVAPAGVELLAARGSLGDAVPAPDAGTGAEQVRHDVHVAGWVLALAGALGGPVSLRGPDESVLSPVRRVDGRTVALGPGDLRLPAGRVAHEFLRTGDDGARAEVEWFDTVRPDAALAWRRQELLVELDDRLAGGRGVAKLERYDHLVSGWALEVRRYRRESPCVVFVCRDRSRARECARRADAVLTACRAYPGEYPASWEYPGRERIVFVAERDAHAGRLVGWGVDRLPPAVRVELAHGDPAAGAAEPSERALPIIDLAPEGS